MSRRSRFEIFRGKDRQHYVRLIASNGRTLMLSEGYTTRDAARDCVAAVRAACVICDVCVVHEDGRKEWVEQRISERLAK